MQQTRVLIALAALLGPGAAAVRADDAVRAAVSFRYDVLPAFTKAGCNAGTCHGTPTGKNGFRLSLRGYDPDLDFETLTREVHGRRIDRLDPDRSLILLKATTQLPHEGGRRFDIASDFYALLRDWVAQGARHDSQAAPTLVALEAAPPRQIIEREHSSAPLRVTARFADGSQRDVTSLARFSVNDESVASVAADGRLERHRRGEVTVSAEYASRFATATVVFREELPGYVWPSPPENNEIDRLVFEKLQQLAIEPSPLCTDEEFVRRVHLDAIGRLPTAGEVRQFLADSDAEKRP
ncbi:MAG TPA: DUF1549 domain-containing protein, partial [Planctomycetaceae bacterium]|nr:DUF1549 domain-containing protein [Planctomycetaceae bacterium]